MTPSRTVEARAPLWIGRILAYITGTVDQELLAGTNEYLTAENLILKAQLKGQLKLSDAERATPGKTARELDQVPAAT
jgi:hypothetical protein